MSHSISPFAQNRFNEWSLQCITGLVQGLWLLLHHQYWILTRTPLRYPVVAMCHGDPAALDLQDRPLHMFHQFINVVDAGVVNSKSRILAWMVAELVSLPALPHTHRQGQLSSMSLANSPKCHNQQGTGLAFLLSWPQGWLTLAFASWDSSTELPR